VTDICGLYHYFVYIYTYVSPAPFVITATHVHIICDSKQTECFQCTQQYWWNKRLSDLWYTEIQKRYNSECCVFHCIL